MRRRRLPVLAPVVFFRRVQRQVRRRNPDEDEGVFPERRDGKSPVRRTQRRIPELQRTGIFLVQFFFNIVILYRAMLKKYTLLCYFQTLFACFHKSRS